MVSNKMVFGALLTLIGLTFSGLSFIYAAMNPWHFNEEMDGIVASLIGTDIWVLLLVAMGIMIWGLVICFKEAYPDAKIW